MDPSGQLLVCCSKDGMVRILNLGTISTISCIHEIRTGKHISHATFSPKGNKFAYVIEEEVVEVYESKTCYKTDTIYHYLISSVAFNHDDDIFAIGFGSK